MNGTKNITSAAVSCDFPPSQSLSPVSAQQPLPAYLLASEREFYGSYPWSLNAYPTVASILKHLRKELNGVDETLAPWQLAERSTNIFLLACALTNEIDDYLVGRRYDFSKLVAVPFGAVAVRMTNRLLAYAQRVREWRLRDLSSWNDRWLNALDDYLQVFVVAESAPVEVLSCAQKGLTALLDANLPADLKGRRLRNPAFFHVRDLTHVDVLKLGHKFVAAYPDRKQPIVLVGLRTAGSYFGPLLRAFLRKSGYQDVELRTLRPRSPISWKERACIAGCARARMMAVVLDEPPCSGGSTCEIAKMLHKAGFAKDKIVGLFPVHSLFRDWKKGWGELLDSGMRTLTLEPEEWFKQELLKPDTSEEVVKEYFRARGYVSAKLVSSENAEGFNAQLRYSSDEKMHTRLKRVYEFQLSTQNGQLETRYVFAKSVGWGWLGYRAFLAGERLQKFLPPVLGLRNGILYTEWLSPVDGDVKDFSSNDGRVETVASYVARRVRLLRLSEDPAPDLARDNLHKGYEELADLLGRAYGSSAAAALKRPRIRHEVSRQKYPAPTLVDGKMWRREWICGTSSLLKTDFEHHAMGKRKLEMTDPAYDLAEGILHFNLAENEERRLITRYVEETGDKDVTDRLFIHKLLAGTWSMVNVLLNLKDPQLRHRRQEFNQQYLDAWEFLTIQTARRCGGLCVRPGCPRWHSPLIVLDVDGVLDRNVFGSFPSSTAAGLMAVSLLHSHGLAVALGSARSLQEVKEYCRCYGFLGGVAEYGSAIWDAVTEQEHVLTSPEALGQMEKLKTVLRALPGVFLNDAYQYSIRAYTFERDRTGPLPTLLISDLLGSLQLDRLRFHQTELDTAVIAKDIDKGTGLKALLLQAGVMREETVAVGDSEPDLDMFRAAGRSFAPSQIWCRDKAVKLGCQIAKRPYQRGLLEIARRIAHADGKRCERCDASERCWRKSDDLFVRLLEVADHGRIPLFFRSILDPMMLRAFVK
jgi:haloacid dehalogenase-like hydrolase